MRGIVTDIERTYLRGTFERRHPRGWYPRVISLWNGGNGKEFPSRSPVRKDVFSLKAFLHFALCLCCTPFILLWHGLTVGYIGFSWVQFSFFPFLFFFLFPSRLFFSPFFFSFLFSLFLTPPSVHGIRRGTGCHKAWNGTLGHDVLGKNDLIINDVSIQRIALVGDRPRGISTQRDASRQPSSGTIGLSIFIQSFKLLHVVSFWSIQRFTCSPSVSFFFPLSFSLIGSSIVSYTVCPVYKGTVEHLIDR